MASLKRKKERVSGKMRKTPIFPVRDILLFIIVVLLSYFILETTFKVYYLVRHEEVGVNTEELCMKEYYKNIANGINFNGFKRLGYYIDDPVIGATLKPDFVRDRITVFSDKSGRELKRIVVYDEHHNSQGMRSLRDYELKKPEDVSVRIAVFGDSFTYGVDVPLKLGMCNLLEELIPNSEVLNFGVPGKGIDNMYLRYLYEARNFSPDIVVFNVYVEDIERYFTSCVLDRPNLTVVDNRIIVGPRPYPDFESFYNSYAPPKFESYFLKHAAFTLNNIGSAERNMKQGFEQFSIILDDVKAKASEDGAYFVVGIITQEHPPALVEKYRLKIGALLEQKGIPYFDSVDVFALNEEAYRGQSFFFIDESIKLSHFGPIGNAVYAQGLKQKLFKAGKINDSNNYFFANYNVTEPLFILNDDAVVVSVVVPSGIENSSYENNLFP